MSDKGNKEGGELSVEELKQSLLQPAFRGSRPFLVSCTSFVVVFGVLPALLLFALPPPSTTTTAHASTVFRASPFPPAPQFLVPAVCLFAPLAWCVLAALASLLPPLAKPPPCHYPLKTAPTPPAAPLRRLRVFVNVAGRGKDKRLLDDLVFPVFQRHGIATEIINTEYAGHCHHVCKTMALDVDGVVAVGGDGTLHECVNGMRSRADGATLPIGVIPTGSGNSFMTDWRLRSRVDVAAEVIAQGFVAELDVVHVRFGDRECDQLASINVVGYAVDQCMCAINADKMRWLLGPLRYDAFGFLGLMKSVPSDATVVCDGKVFATNATTVFLSRTQYFGRQMRAAPAALLDDGNVHVAAVLSSQSRLHNLRVFNLLPSGRHGGLLPMCAASRVSVHVASDDDTVGLIGVDGETVVRRGRVVDLHVVQRAWKAFVPSREMFDSYMSAQ